MHTHTSPARTQPSHPTEEESGPAGRPAEEPGAARFMTVEQVGAALVGWYEDVLAFHDATDPDTRPGTVTALAGPSCGLPGLGQVEDPYVAAEQIRELLTRLSPPGPSTDGPPRLPEQAGRPAPQTSYT